jgi:micrococcal nuclease
MLQDVTLRRCISLLFVALTLLFGGCSQPTGGTGPAPAVGGQGRVVKVLDGDTLDIALGRRTERVRLLGIDTPESVKPDTPVECFAKEASSRLHALLPDGTAVRLVRDAEERDRFGRLLAYVYRLPDGVFVNLDLVRGGYARVLTFRPNVAHASELERAARDARRSARGLWGACPAASSLPP